jgi:hypothetical protein
MNPTMLGNKKLCPKCKLFLSLNSFKQRSGRPHCLASYCRPCSKIHARDWARRNSGALLAYKYRTRYGLTIAKYESIVKKQNGHCAICLEIVPKLVIDHDHKTRKVRGLLCHHCNTFLGLAKDSTSTLESAIRYLNGQNFNN